MRPSLEIVYGGCTKAIAPFAWAIETRRRQRYALELYDLKTDRAEQNNLAAKMPDKVKELEQAWQQQTDNFTVLARQTMPEKPAAKGAKAKAKNN